ncbi:hypothetical protein [Polyangium jinanense]|uniref:Uncharacterized protein n=1 Tax=Polyangium jinanense TaxID=2829994 RepID=A0A9X4AUT3_9BACT|nr:hypothetical protein [Polyangium jinanense]MDC3956619.1 hypothetical protein [Polyangium jinanense]MDC3985598.1 hypothetical protein [Polyangium jinanense]
MAASLVVGSFTPVRNRDPQFLLAAALLHAAVILAVWFTASSPSPRNEGSQTEAPGQERDEIAFDLVSDTPTQKPEKAPAPIARVAPAKAPRVGHHAPRRPTHDAPGEDAPYPDPEPLPAAGANAGSQEAPAEQPPTLPGLDGKPIWAVPGVLPAPALAGRVSSAPPPAPEEPTIAPSLGQKALDYLASRVPPPPSAYERRDPIQHFPAAGTLASAVTDELRSSTTPAESDTHFELVVDAQGHLVSVHVVAADPAHRKAAEHVARAIAERFSGQTFPLPDAFAAGSRIRVGVKSEVVLPNGAKHHVSDPRLSLPGVSVPLGSQEYLFDERSRPGLAGVLPNLNLGIELSFKFDLATLGSTRKRVLHTRVNAVPLASATQ